MKDEKIQYRNIDEYIASCDPEAGKMLTELRNLIRQEAPDAVEVISYNMPAFKLSKRILCYFAAHKSHIGFYPADARIIERRREELKGFSTSKGTIQFPLGQPVPVPLVVSIIRQRVGDIAMKTAIKRSNDKL